MEDVNKRDDEIFFLFLNLSAVPKKSAPGKFVYIRHFQRIGVKATKFEKTLIHLKVAFSLPSPSSMLKLPIIINTVIIIFCIYLKCHFHLAPVVQKRYAAVHRKNPYAVADKR